MNLIRHQPLNEMTFWPERFNRLFEDTLATWLNPEQNRDIWYPAVDLYEDEQKVVLKADLPDLNEKDLNIEVANGTLTLKGERKFEKEDKRDGYHHVERRFGSFVRRFSLPPTVDSDKITADYQRGVLTVEMPKREEARPKQVKVSAGKV